MIRAIAVAALLLSAPACRTEILRECPVAAGAAGTCDEACTNLEDLDCRPGDDQAECVAACEAASANVPDEVLGRVLACYASVDSCRAVDGCSRACGEDDGPVPWNLDGGIEEPDASMDAGPDGG